MSRGPSRAGWRPGADALLAVLLPLACVLALAGLRPDRGQPELSPPDETPLTASAVVCPAALPAAAGTGPDVVGVTVAADAPASGLRGEVLVGPGDAGAPLAVRAGRVASAAAGPDPVVVRAEDELAPGLLAGRSRPEPLAAVGCAAPIADRWFTAVGAGATHDSVVELVNPDAGPAVVDITVRGPGGVLDVPALRGVAVPGGTSTRIDLGQVVPRRGELALEVRTSRGRLAVHVVDSYDELGAGTRGEEWLPEQAEPQTRSVLLGIAGGAGERTLVLANPGEDEVRATLEVVTPTSVFAPAGAEPVRVPPGATEAVPVTDLLAQEAAAGATGLLVESTGPVTATLRQLAAGDLSLLTAAAPLAAATAAVVPAGASDGASDGARLLLGAPETAGAATVTTYDARGRQLDEQRVELAAEAGADVELPEGATLVSLRPEGTEVTAALLLSGAGVAVVPLRPLALTGLVPDVRPGVP